MKKTLHLMLIFSVLYGCSDLQHQKDKQEGEELERAFLNPPDSARPWVLWDWISGNVSREGITNDLESMRDIGIGGVVWRELAGKWWAPEGQAAPYSSKWDSLMQWAIQEAERLELEFSMSQDFGYGSGGPHITPDISTQEIFWSDTIIDGGDKINMVLERPLISKKNVAGAWLREGKKLSRKVLDDIEQIDSYRDIAVMAFPHTPDLEGYIIPQLQLRTGMGWETYFKTLEKLSPPPGVEVQRKDMVNLTSNIKDDGRLEWDAPPGRWKIIRIGHASTFRMTRPCPTNATGLECDRLNSVGIDTHFEYFFKPILENAGSRAGKTLTHVFLDSWEAFSQNWTQGFNQEFYNRRNYDIQPWLPALTGTIVENAEMTERFLWDFRQTVSEMILENYIQRISELIAPYGLEFLIEAYGNLNVNSLKYAELADFPMSEFWTMGDDKFPTIKVHKLYNSMKAMASAAHTTGRTNVGAEAFTGGRGWKDHPYIFKGAGDEAFCRGVNHFILHLSAHQAYEQMIPGLTHQRWGGHFNRFNTWWAFSKPWFEYIARCQYLLKQGQFIADVCYFFGEGAPLDVTEMQLDLPSGFDYNVCSSDILQQMEVKGGKIVLPSGISYRYLLLPDADRLTLSSAQKISELVKAGAKVIGQRQIIGTPGLTGYPDDDQKVKSLMDELWSQGKIRMAENWNTIFEEDGVTPDFVADGLDYIHRRKGETDIYFVSNPEPEAVKTICTFRIEGKTPELWNPETGEIQALTNFRMDKGGVTLDLHFDPMQSWFIIFRKKGASSLLKEASFPVFKSVMNINGPWLVSFDPEWGGPAAPVAFETLQDWSEHSEPGIYYYSGTAKYSKTFNLSSSQLSESVQIMLDLGNVEVMAKVNVNGKECGIAWKPPFRVDISQAVKPGENLLEIEVVNTWVNRMIGDEQLPEDLDWIDWVRLREWPEWFREENTIRPTKRYTFTTAKHYGKDDQLLPSGLLGPVKILIPLNNEEN